MYVILTDEGSTVTECYIGWARDRVRAERHAERAGGGTVVESSWEGILKIEAQIAREREYLETLRTGLSRKTRGT